MSFFFLDTFYHQNKIQQQMCFYLLYCLKVKNKFRIRGQYKEKTLRHKRRTIEKQMKMFRKLVAKELA